MQEWLLDTFYTSLTALGGAAEMLMYPAVFFVLLALGFKGSKVFTEAAKILPETTTTLGIVSFNVLFVLPMLAVLSVVMKDIFEAGGLMLIDETMWENMPFFAALLIAVLIMDFGTYWRHRMMHSPMFWPSHAVHHSDTAVTWLTLIRAHPVDHLTTSIMDNVLLLMLGFPIEVVIASVMIRHYYGYFVHADLPWTYGKIFGKIFISPAMHRWHHADEPRAYNTNYAAVFAFYDYIFGTYYVPGPCNVPLGVQDDMGKGVFNQLTYAFKPRAYKALFANRKKEAAEFQEEAAE